MTRRGYSIFQRRKGIGPFYVSVPDPLRPGKRKTRMASPDKKVAEEIGRTWARDNDRVRAGVITAAESAAREHGQRPIIEHIDAWRDSMRQRGTGESHYRWQHNRVKRLMRAANVESLAMLTAEKAQAALAYIQTEKRGKQWPVTSPQTARHYFVALKSFVKWCLQSGRLIHDPLLAVKRPKAAGEVFRRTPIELARVGDLVTATWNRRHTRDRLGHDPKDRAMLWALMAYTGLRRGEALSLTRESFNLEGGFVVLEAKDAKNDKRVEQPIPAAIAPLLGMWLADKSKGKLFPFGNHWACEELFRGDCGMVGIVPGAGERLGTHSLRRAYITAAIRSAGLKVAQDLARHSTPTLTAKYSDLTINDLNKALDGMPKVLPPGTCSAPARNSATG